MCSFLCADEIQTVSPESDISDEEVSRLQEFDESEILDSICGCLSVEEEGGNSSEEDDEVSAAHFTLSKLFVGT